MHIHTSLLAGFPIVKRPGNGMVFFFLDMLKVDVDEYGSLCHTQLESYLM